MAALKPALAGFQYYDCHLSREQDRVLDDEQRPIWRVTQSGQYHTVVQAAKVGMAQVGSCFSCGAQQQTWVHLWVECPGLSLQRGAFGSRMPRAPHGVDLRLLCQKVLAEPNALPRPWQTSALPCFFWFFFGVDGPLVGQAQAPGG